MIQPNGESGLRLKTSAPAVDSAKKPNVVRTRSGPPPILPNDRSENEPSQSSAETPQMDHASPVVCRASIGGPSPAIVQRVNQKIHLRNNASTRRSTYGTVGQSRPIQRSCSRWSGGEGQERLTTRRTESALSCAFG